MRNEDQSLLESRLKEQFGVGEVVLLGRASLGLMLVLQAWSRRSGPATVCLSPIVCQDVIAAVIASGCALFFVDVDPNSGEVPESEWLRAKNSGAKVALVVHLYGNGSDVRMVERIFDGDECLVIDDAAQALGTRVNGELAGSMGDVGLLSFGQTKQITSGGAAVLIQDREFATEVRRTLQDLKFQDSVAVRMTAARFRARFDRARACLRSGARGSADAFQDILEDYAQTLFSPLTSEMIAALPLALDHFPKAVEARKMKAEIWSNALAGSVLYPVGMDSEAVPWRYACRLLGATWTSQHEIGELIRARGINVSHWYLPGHWLTQGALLELAGAEKMSREAFQFWVDDSLSCEEVSEQAAQVRRTVDRGCFG